MKRCTKCHQFKAEGDFAFKNLLKNKKHAHCRACQAKYRNKHYSLHKKKYIDKALKWNKRQAEVLQEFLYNTLLRSFCLMCGESDILVLEFDHRENKKFDIAQMYKRRYSLRAIKSEIEKCDVLCANCHRRKTAIENTFWKYRLLQKTK